MPAKPLFSVITPLYNSGAYIDECMDSVAAQTLEDWEQIIVDDGSTDQGLQRALARARVDSRVRVVRRRENGGAGAARNEAFKVMRGRYVAFLDADDRWLPHKLALQADQLRHSDAVLVYSPFEKINAAGERTNRVVRVPERLDYERLRRGCWIACLTVAIDRERAGTIRMNGFRRSQDYALWLSLLRNGGHAESAGEVTALYRVRPGSLSRNLPGRLAANWAIHRHQEQAGPLASAWYIGCHLTGALYRRLV
ncbi:glycosyltransferase family 2 protein [Alkalilimnicola ehrlichii MLHE-1]|uniref:Glycosyl transferase, family 2 n=1 Tax=Alkalilimnicola ehrlichii (strain ATCC BAA-1101 / DSM 17681 / MLHE-1) TaxID=187272 RepID=Q0A644_ALKEH|nr:glycosyltransferase family A protein [Alkalilimnicola ehrlichii]ABI57693.1 glycosyl transferase, family 2 [Alkalilimnicola ehrlichii MLHE-1]